jgi:hypothetical protein
MTLHAVPMTHLTPAEQARRRKWLGRAGVLWNQANWIACKLEAPAGPPQRLRQRGDREEELAFEAPDGHHEPELLEEDCTDEPAPSGQPD